MAMKINEDVIIPTLGKSLLDSIIAASEIDSTGSNSNGSYMKLKNGIMIQWGKQSFGIQDFNADWWGFAKRSSQQNMRVTFPIPFASAPCCIINPNANTAFSIFSGNSGTTLTTQSQGFTLASPNTYTESREVTCYFIAIGNWK